MDHRLNTAFWALRIGLGLGALLAGLDKFFNILTDWSMYLSPLATRVLPISSAVFMRAVGGDRSDRERHEIETLFVVANPTWRGPEMIGLNVTSTAQLAPGDRLELQVLVCEKSTPETRMSLGASTVTAWLVRVTAAGGPAVPTGRSPKSSSPGEIVTAGWSAAGDASRVSIVVAPSNRATHKVRASHAFNRCSW